MGRGGEVATIHKEVRSREDKLEEKTTRKG